MTALADLVRADRERLADRVRELDELDDLMRRPGTLAEAPAPPPLHRTNHDATTEGETP